MQRWDTADNPDDPNSNPTNGDRGVGYETVHLQALLDEQGRISVLAIHNSDISDGREREGEHLDYFKVFYTDDHGCGIDVGESGNGVVVDTALAANEGSRHGAVMNELVFQVTQEGDGGFVAEARGESIFTQADTWDELRTNVREAVAAFYFDRPAPARVRLHLVRDEVLA